MYNFVTREPTSTLNVTGYFVAERLFYPVLRQNLGCYKNKDEGGVETVVNSMADNTVHGLISTGIFLDLSRPWGSRGRV